MAVFTHLEKMRVLYGQPEEFQGWYSTHECAEHFDCPAITCLTAGCSAHSVVAKTWTTMSDYSNWSVVGGGKGLSTLVRELWKASSLQSLLFKVASHDSSTSHPFSVWEWCFFKYELRQIFLLLIVYLKCVNDYSPVLRKGTCAVSLDNMVWFNTLYVLSLSCCKIPPWQRNCTTEMRRNIFQLLAHFPA